MQRGAGHGMTTPPRAGSDDRNYDDDIAAALDHPRRRRWLTIAAVLCALACVAILASEYVAARHTLHRERAALAVATDGLHQVRTSVTDVRGRTTALNQQTATVARTARAVRTQRSYFAALTQNASKNLSGVKDQLNQAEIALLGVASNTNQVAHCLDGISLASNDISHGDSHGAANALNTSAADCAKSFALATGAAVPYDFPDPYVLAANSQYYAYSTNSGAGDIQVLASPDLGSWHFVGNALSRLPGWAAPHSTWAPSVMARGGGYVVYYTVREAATGRQCVSRAVSRSPAGPFVDTSGGPLVCQPGGSIDPSPYVDAGGNPWLLWKAEGYPGAAATIWSQPLTPDGKALAGTASALIAADRWYEAGVVEGPSMFGLNGEFVLMYSAGNWQTHGYNEAYAVCSGPAGPCTKPGDGRVLTSGSRLAGPGGGEVFASGGGLWLAFHAYNEGAVGYPNSRYLHVAPLHLVNGRPVIGTST
ncbi:MAG: glycoside hydrolase, family 43 [Actinomycetia bacterium]|nr:glycoside hydrolase, family 43 [Actinomycetes bacterium]